MKLGITIEGDLARLAMAEIAAAERAVTAGVSKAGAGLKADWRRQITGAGLRERLARTIRNRTYPEHEASILDLEARESIGAIRAAFAAGHVELRIAGDLEEAEIALGLRTSRITPPPRLDWFDELQAWEGEEPLFDLGADVLSGPATNPLRHVGRNDPCPCGSGRKFKRCCGRS